MLERHPIQSLSTPSEVCFSTSPSLRPVKSMAQRESSRSPFYFLGEIRLSKFRWPRSVFEKKSGIVPWLLPQVEIYKKREKIEADWLAACRQHVMCQLPAWISQRRSSLQLNDFQLESQLRCVLPIKITKESSGSVYQRHLDRSKGKGQEKEIECKVKLFWKWKKIRKRPSQKLNLELSGKCGWCFTTELSSSPIAFRLNFVSLHIYQQTMHAWRTRRERRFTRP